MALCDESLQKSIEKNAKGPASISGDEGSVSQHSLRDQIEVDKYLAGKTGTANPKTRGLRFNRIKPGGTI